METYCQKVELEKFHAFLIFTASRFTENNLKLAKKVRSIEKKFFFIRTKIDENVQAEMRKRSFNEDAMLGKIRRNCVENLGDLMRYVFDKQPFSCQMGFCATNPGHLRRPEEIPARKSNFVSWQCTDKIVR